ncbi:MAG: ribosome biogenesis/translation initiation ATPase RLI [Candidatus Aenigmarchaeota archaeon]
MTNRIAIVDRELCKPKITGFACQKACPVNRTGKDCITVSEEDAKVLIDEGLCIGCGICVKKCFRNALMIVNLPEKLKETPIHRYGKNMFCLFRLPIPKEGNVVGLIGENGTGKSTVLNILSGSLKPNTGLLKGAGWENIISRFKGTELQGFMESLAASRLSAAYKPQHVDAIPKMWKGKVKDFLKKADEGNILDDVVKRLGIEEMMGKGISQLSGGELQLLAIAATFLKKRDFYFFDEPSSYLDVRERLKVAREIRKLSEKAKVLVVEHDLSVADYLADITHILYGKAGAFGIVSKPYGVRIGINTYLEGYIREENMRFRDEPIVFQKTAKRFEKTHLFLQFPAFSKKFRDFSLETEGGNLYKGEVIGILGPNATGKSTFMKMLVGKEKPDKGEALSGLKLAYKPQRLMLSEDEKGMTVGDYLGSRGIKMGTESKRLIEFLRMGKRMERKMGNLSGGELQTVLIISVLLQEKDIMLLDEPSAFLDVEQRLRVAKALKSQVEEMDIPCFVVDHDILFIDVLSDRIMVFAGEQGVSGKASAPTSLKDGMNSFLKSLGVTFRRDPQTGRPRANKPNSQKDKDQKEKGKYYYAD